MQLIFTVPYDVDYRWSNTPTYNEVCAVLNFNADHSFPLNEMVVKPQK